MKKLCKKMSIFLVVMLVLLIPLTAFAASETILVPCYYGSTLAAHVGVEFTSTGGKVSGVKAYAGWGTNGYLCTSQSAQAYGTNGISASAKVRTGSSSTLYTATGKITGF